MNNLSNFRRDNLFSIIFLLCLTIIFFWKAVLLRGVFFVGDFIAYYFPVRFFSFNLLRKGQIPLWTPYLFSGFPLFAEGQEGVFYPLNALLFLFLPAYVAANYSVVLHFFLAGLFMYLYLRVIKADRSSSLISAITFMFSGHFIVNLTYLNYLNVLIWLPLILLFVELAIQRDRLIYALLAGVAVALQFFAGHIYPSIYILTALFLYLVFKAICAFREGRKRRIAKLLLVGGVIVVVGFGLWSVQLLPTLELLKLSIRSTPLSYDFWTGASFPPKHFITLLLPHFYGNPINDTYFGAWYYMALCGYVGILPLILALIAILFRKDRFTFFFLSLSLIAILLALGKYNPLYNLLSHLPVYNRIRTPGWWLYLYTFAISVSAGLGFNFLSKTFKVRDKLKLVKIGKFLIYLSIGLGTIMVASFIKVYFDKTTMLTAIKGIDSPSQLIGTIGRIYTTRLNDLFLFAGVSMVSIILLISHLKQRISQSIFKWLAIFLILINLFIFARGFNPLISPRVYIDKPESVSFLEKDRSIFRIYSWQTGKANNRITRSMINNLQPYDQLIKSFTESLFPNFGMIHGISTINATWVSSEGTMPGAPLPLKRYSEFITTLNPRSPHLNLVNLLNVKYILTPRKIEFEPFNLVFSNREIKIYENKNCLPRAFLVYKAKIIKDKEKTLKEISRIDFNPREYVVLEKDIETKASLSSLSSTGESKAQIIEYLPRKVVIKTNLPRDGFLVLSDTYYPGWKVYVDGREDKIYRANYILRAVCLNEGAHIVKFIYHPLSFKVGAVITLLTIIFLTMTITFLKFRERRNIS